MKTFFIPVEILNSKGSLFCSIVLSRTSHSRESAITVLRSDIRYLTLSLGEGFSIKVDFSRLVVDDAL